MYFIKKHHNQSIKLDFLFINYITKTVIVLLFQYFYHQHPSLLAFYRVSIDVLGMNCSFLKYFL